MNQDHWVAIPLFEVADLHATGIECPVFRASPLCEDQNQEGQASDRVRRIIALTV